MKLRKTVLAVATTGLLLGGLAGPAVAETELSFGHFVPTRHVMHDKVFAPLAERIAEITDGEVKVTIFPSGELGAGPAKQYSRAIDGVADITFGIQGYTSSVFPRTLVTELPGLFDDSADAVDTVWRNFDLFAPDYERVKVLAVWFNTPAVIATRDKPVKTIDDLKGLTIRAPSALGSAVLEAWGANAVTVPAPEIYNSLQTGVFDGVYIGVDGMRSFRLNEVTSHITFGLPTALTAFFMVANRDAWDAIPAAQQAAIEEIIGPDLSRQAAAAYDAFGAGARDVMEKDGLNIIDLGPDEAQPFTAALDGVYGKVAADLDAQGIAGQAIIDALAN